MKCSFLRKLFLFITFTSFIAMSSNGQTPVKKYEKEWKKIESFIEKGLPQSALAEVKKLYQQAKNEKQDAQVIKTLTYISRLQQETREDNESLSVAEIEKEISTSKEPVASILKSLLADKYWEYFQNNRWKLYDQTQTAAFKKDDIATWGIEDFHAKITDLYLQSIGNEKLLQQTKLEPFDAIITKGNMRHLRPTLYDLLAFRALDYFSTDERDISKPAYAFEIDKASAFAPASSFVTERFTTKDESSLEYKALLIYQKLLAFHLSDFKPDALIDADILRLQFVKSKSTHPDKDNLYYNALKQLTSKYGNQNAAMQAWYLMALVHEDKASGYKPYGDTTGRYERLKAKEICEMVLRQKDSSEGRLNCRTLLREINTQSFHLFIEKVNVPSLPFRALVKYKNITSLHFRLVRATESLKKELENQYSDSYWDALLAASPIKSWQQNLPDTKDLQEHLTEIKIDGLAPDSYILIASGNKEFSTKKSILGARLFFVSGISYVNMDNNYFVLNRDNGQPLAKAAVQLWEQKYDYKASKYIREKGRLFITDEHGYFKMEKPKRNTNDYGNYAYLLDISYNNDRLFTDEYTYDYYYNNQPEEEPKSTTTIFLFTDRSLYRPGQTVYFKGIVIAGNAGKKTASVQSNYSAEVVLRDANGQEVQTLTLQTNEYGSFNGKFQLPETGLNGDFSIFTRGGNGNASFKVEEYKRPKFYVDYETIKGTYKVNDKIKVSGFAKAYAGNNIDGALVKYRVVRQPRFIYDWCFWRWWQPPSEEMEIAHGEVKTDKEGKFIVEFTAIPDLKIDKKFEPVFDYTVYADVTDINGETRSGEKMVSVSYKALMLVAGIPASIAADSLKMLSIMTQNMNGEHEPATLNVNISRLNEEKRLIRNRYWERPDQFVMSKNEYTGYFPHDEYNNESDYKSWEKGPGVFSKADSSRIKGEFSLGGQRLPAGYYMVEITAKDKNGEEVKDIRYMELFDEKSNQLSRPQYLWTDNSRSTVEPGEVATIALGSSAGDLFIVHQVNKKTYPWQPFNNYSFLSLNKEKKTFSFATTESDRGGFGASWMFVKDNRLYQVNETITVPWTNKDLSIEYTTFRDKTLPGSEEKWKVKISGYKKEKVAAEMLASMYDASLDQFYPHGWGAPYIWNSFYNSISWSGAQNFNSGESIERYLPAEPYQEVDKRYDFMFRESYYTLDYNYRSRGGNYLYKMTFAASADMAAPAPGVGAVEEKGTTTNYMMPDAKKQKDGYYQNENSRDKPTAPQKQPATQGSEVKIRKNFNETAFFLPDLHTDADGSIEFSFTMPEALTKWKFMALAHTKDAAFGTTEKEIVTQKDLMVQPNAPRFLREGDKMEFTSKVVNLTDKELTGTAQLELVDAATNQPVDGWFRNMAPNQYFTVAAGQSEVVRFPIEVPYLFNKALVWRVVAKAGNFSDGEENAMPVLTNRMLVTETLPLAMRGTGSKSFAFTKLLNSGSSSTLQHYGVTVEYTSNPAWYAIQALPYLMEYPYECAEQTWNRYYANSLASHIANSSPKIKAVFDKWNIKDTAALMSNLQKNQELKAVLLEETPWVMEAKNEAQQKKYVATLFDLVRMSQQLGSAFQKLKQMQSENGGFVWFTGGPDDRYITQYIITGIGHLRKLNVNLPNQQLNLSTILTSGIPYLDRKMKEDYDDLIRYKVNLKTYTPGYTTIQYLYMRSFFPDYPIDAAHKTAYNYFRERAQKTWLEQSKYMQGMIALAMYRTGDTVTPAAILKSLKETSINNEELGMYWKNLSDGWFWYEAPIETQSLLIEAFQEAGKDTKAVDDLRTWLLKNKQTSNWKTTKATAEACYALLLQGTEWLSNEPAVEIKLGSTTIRSTDVQQEAGTGYFKKVFEGKNVSADMGNIAVKISSPLPSDKVGPSWGGVYWQYFEDLDKITSAATPLKLSKKLFVEKNTDRGPVITPVNDGDVLHIGDKIKVRVELRVDRDMEYVHMKDMRASALEPVNVLSQYKWQGGLGYYESTKDASTNFFFSYLQKGTYVFEYPLFVTHAGNFSNGITTIQCMYAPEFSSHSEGVRITVE